MPTVEAYGRGLARGVYTQAVSASNFGGRSLRRGGVIRIANITLMTRCGKSSTHALKPRPVGPRQHADLLH